MVAELRVLVKQKHCRAERCKKSFRSIEEDILNGVASFLFCLALTHSPKKKTLEREG